MINRREFFRVIGLGSLRLIYPFYPGEQYKRRAQANALENEEVVVKANFADQDSIAQFDFVPDYENFFNITKDGTKDSVLAIKEIGPLLNNPRRPRTYAVLKDYLWRKAEITVDVRYTHSLGTPDVIIPFAYQDANNWYYVHVSNKSDGFHNVIMKVHGSDRHTVHTMRNRAPLQNTEYYTLKVVFDTTTGSVEVYCNDNGMEEPFLVGQDKVMNPGFVGIGSFDTYAFFHNFTVRGELV